METKNKRPSKGTKTLEILEWLESGHYLDRNIGLAYFNVVEIAWVIKDLRHTYGYKIHTKRFNNSSVCVYFINDSLPYKPFFKSTTNRKWEPNFKITGNNKYSRAFRYMCKREEVTGAEILAKFDLRLSSLLYHIKESKLDVKISRTKGDKNFFYFSVVNRKEIMNKYGF